MNSTKKIIYISLFISLSIVLTRMFSFYALPTVRVGFGNVPIMLSGILLGPMSGAVTGGLSDLVGMLIFPSGGPYFPGFTLSKMVLGAIPGFMARRSKGSGPVRMALAVVVAEIVSSLVLDTIWLSIYYNKGIMVLLPPRIITRIFVTAAEIPLVLAIALIPGNVLRFGKS